MTSWVWLDIRDVLAVHDARLAEHGGLTVIRDQGALDPALARAPNLAAYGSPDAAELAAAYGFGIAKNHPFADGNKRSALVATEFFLELNGYSLVADDVTCVLTILSLADGTLSEAELAAWIRSHTEPLP